MAEFDPDVFGAPAAASQGFDPDVFSTPKANSPAPAAAPAPTGPTRGKFDLRGEGYDRAMNYNPTDAIAGMTRGAGSIGATLLAPFDVAGDLLRGKGLTLDANRQRRQEMDAGLQSLGANPNSTQFQTNKLLGEVAGTAGVGTAAANLLSRIPGAAAQIPSLLQAIRTGGMTTGAPAGASRVAGMGVRVAGGAINGGLTAGAVNPEDAGTGMEIGGAFPVVAKLFGGAGDVLGSLFKSKTPLNPTKLQTAKESMDAGYVIPPSMIEPSLKNRVMESTSGKQATQQMFSTKNTEVTEKLTRQALGIADDVPLTQSTLENLRKTAGKAYAEVSNLSPQAAADLEALKVARNEASAQFKFYNRSADPKALAAAKEARAMSDTLETALEAHAQEAGRPELIPALRDARKAIAKTYTVGRALNDASGTVDARVFGRMHEKGLPLSDGLDTAGKFASAFPTAAKSPQQIGSPGVHNLTSMFSTGSGAAGAAAGAFLGGPVGAGVGSVVGAAYPYVVPPIVRARMMSPGFQQGLLNQGSPSLLSGSLDEVLPLMYRSSGLLAGRSGQ